MSTSDPFAPDFVHHFHGGGRIELWNDGEVVVWDAMDRDMDDYELKPQYIARLKSIVLEAGPMARWHHFLREMVVEDVEFKGSRRKKLLVKDRINPQARSRQPSWLRTARALISTARGSRGRSHRRNPMARRRSKSRNPRRGTRRGTGGWIKRHGKWVKGALARGGRPARRARRSRSSYRTKHRSKSRRSTRRSFSHRRGRSAYRRNPASTQFHDGTSIQISGDNVTVITSYGETYEYSEVDARARARVMTARTGAQARKILNGAGVLASINPRRGRKSRRSKHTRRNCGRMY